MCLFLLSTQVAQYHQKIDINAITVYLSKNLRNVCLTSSYSLILAISTMKTRVPLPIPESSQQTTPQPSVSLPRASMPKMTLNPVSVKECSESSMKYYSYHLKHHLPTNCAGEKLTTFVLILFVSIESSECVSVFARLLVSQYLSELDLLSLLWCC